MCGIVACVGSDNPKEVLLGGLERLEYRGYDSAGIALLDEQDITIYKCTGKVTELTSLIQDNAPETATTGIGHTRWATHGEPTTSNAHPHVSPSGRFALVHNGIIENYKELKGFLIEEGYSFQSETDTEVLVCLIEYEASKSKNIKTHEAVRKALTQVAGAYAITVLDQNRHDQLVVARKGGPLVIGVGKKTYYAASDASPIVPYTDKVVYLGDGELAVLTPSKKPHIMDISDAARKSSKTITIDAATVHVEKGGFDHFMLKEIFDQPEALRNSLRGRILLNESSVRLGGIGEYEQQIARANRLIIIACGTSWHAGLVAEYMFERLCRIPVEVEYASEFRYRQPIINSGDVVIAISQSGETADTLAALEMAKSKGALILGICNVAGSSIARLTDAGIYTHAGPEVSVASTKAFTTQVSVLFAMALRVAQLNATIGPSRLHGLLAELDELPHKIEHLLTNSSQIKKIAKDLYKSDDILYVGRGVSFPVALEGALKLKEVSYIHAEGYPAGELKHGPIALIDEKMPVVVIAPSDSSEEKTLSNLQEIKARKGRIILVTNRSENMSDMAHWVIQVPETNELLSPILTSIPLQLLAYYVAVNRELEVDRPRNLAKSVTVE